MYSQLLWSALGGLLVGALGCLAAPGPHPLRRPLTLLLGLGGGVAGGALATEVLGGAHQTVSLVVAVVVAAVLVSGLAAYQRSRRLPQN